MPANALGHQHQGPCAVRYPRGKGCGAVIEPEFTALEIGRGRRVREGKNVAILFFGTFLPNVLQAAEELDAAGIERAIREYLEK